MVMMLHVRVVVVVVDHVMMVVVVDLANRAALAVHAVHEVLMLLAVAGVRRGLSCSAPLLRQTMILLPLASQRIQFWLDPLRLRVEDRCFPIAVRAHQLISLATASLRLPALMLIQIRQAHILLISEMVVVIDLILANKIMRTKLRALLSVTRVRKLLLLAAAISQVASLA